METVTDFIFLGSKITADGDCSHEIKRCLLLGRKAWTNLDSILKAEILLCQQVPYSQSYGFSSSHTWMWELDHKESWVLKNWCFWSVVLEKTLESPLDCKEIKPVNPKGNQSWIVIGKTDDGAEASVFWPPDAKSWLIGKDPDAGKDWRQEEKGRAEDKMVGCYHQLNGHEFEQAPGDSEEEGRLACCCPWGCKELGMTELLNNNIATGHWKSLSPNFNYHQYINNLWKLYLEPLVLKSIYNFEPLVLSWPLAHYIKWLIGQFQLDSTACLKFNHLFLYSFSPSYAPYVSK